VHGASTDGGVAFRKKLARAKVLTFLAEHPLRCCYGGLRERPSLGTRHRRSRP
jgi:hypothetical protein